MILTAESMNRMLNKLSKIRGITSKTKTITVSDKDTGFKLTVKLENRFKSMSIRNTINQPVIPIQKEFIELVKEVTNYKIEK